MILKRLPWSWINKHSYANIFRNAFSHKANWESNRKSVEKSKNLVFYWKNKRLNSGEGRMWNASLGTLNQALESFFRFPAHWC